MKIYYLITVFMLSTIFVTGQIPCSDLDNPPGCPLCDALFQGSTEGFSPDSIDYDFPCGGIENSQWHSVIADDSGTISFYISTICNLGTGLEVLIYDSNLQPFSNCFTINDNSALQVFALGTTIGSEYYILIDGIDGSNCEFAIQSLEGVSFFTPQLSFSGILPSGFNICEETACFTLAQGFPDISYKWETRGNGTIVSGGSFQDTFVCIRYDSLINLTTLPGSVDTVGSAFVSVSPFTDCTQGNINSALIWIIPTDPIIDTTICPGSCFLFEGICYTEPENVNIQTPCGKITRINLSFADTSDFKISCFVDSFTNNLAIDWDELGADSFDIFIDDLYQNTQAFSSYLLPFDDIPGDEVKIKIVPSSILGCDFKTSETICKIDNPSVSSYHSSSKNIKIFPNPTSETVEIQSSNLIEKVSIFDLSGKFLFETSNSKIDLSKYDSGVYFFKIETAKDISIKKIIVL